MKSVDERPVGGKIKGMVESDSPLTNTRQRREEVSKGKGRKKGIGKQPLPIPDFTFGEVRMVKGSLRRIPIRQPVVLESLAPWQ